MSPTKTLNYNIVTDEGKRSSVTLFVGSKPYVATSEHPNFDTICDALEAGDESQKQIVALFDASDAIREKLAETGIDTKVTIKRGRVYYDNKEIGGPLVEKILAFNRAKVDFKPLARFLSKIEKNPSTTSKATLFTWLESHNYTICADGDFLAYKSVKDDQDFKSSYAGHAIVNGVPVRGNIPNVPGSIISMPRHEVREDPTNECASGLHVADFGFARSFLSNGTVLRVKVNPVNVVSVPRHSGFHKMRVCEYRVVQIVKSEQDDLLFDGAFKTAKLKGTTNLKFVEVDERLGGPVPVKSRGGRKAPARKPAKAAKKAPAKKPRGAAKKAAVAKAVEFPDYYEDFTLAQFRQLPVTELRWLAREWAADDDVAIQGGIARATAETLVRVLSAAARKRKKLL